MKTDKSTVNLYSLQFLNSNPVAGEWKKIIRDAGFKE